MDTPDPTTARLEDQIEWYDRRSKACQFKFKLLKGIEIFSAVAITLAGSFEMSRVIIACLGALVLLLEAVQHLNQYQQSWITYRSTCESLKHEKYLFLATAGPYSTASDPVKLLAERIEGLISQEHAKWISGQEDAAKRKPPRNSQG